MNKYQSARLDSFNLIVKESNNHPESIALVPKFGVVISQLQNICSGISELQLLQEKDITGITANKVLTLDNLIDSTLDIAGAIHSYAYDKSNFDLLAKINYKASDLDKMTQSEILAAAAIVAEEAQKISPEDLALEGISFEEMATFEGLIEQFSGIKSLPREATIDRLGATEKINQLFKEASALLKNKLDRLAIQFRRKDPDFYLIYRAARVVQYHPAPKREPEMEQGTN